MDTHQPFPRGQLMVAFLGSTPRPVLPAVTWAAFRLVARETVSREEAADLLLPSVLRDDGGRPASALVAIEALVDLGLLDETEDRLGIDPQIAGADLDDERWFRRELRARVLTTERNTNLETSNDGARELTKALAWFLAQPVDNPPVLYSPSSKAETNSVTQLINEQFGSDDRRMVLQNSYRWAPFQRWGKFLGFIRFLPVRDGGPCPDPSDAIRDTLFELEAELAGEIELPRLITALAKALPVLDGGSYRTLVEEKMDSRPVSAGGGEVLSASLSLALLRLKEEGVLDLRRVSDSPATRTLSIRQGHRLPYSHAKIARPTGGAA